MSRKAFSPDLNRNSRLLVFTGRIEDSQEAAHHQIIDTAFIYCHMVQLDELFRRNNRMVVGNPGIIYKKQLSWQWTADQPPGCLTVRPHGAGL